MPILIEHEAELDSLAGELQGETVFYLDTEFDSRATGTTLCLVQLCARDEVYLLDALALRDLSVLAETVGNPDGTWVLHSSHQDLPLLRRALGTRDLPQVFDTQIAWALSSPEPATSFAYLNYKLLGTRSSKQHQTDDWLRRPLTRSQLSYAAHDVDTLPQLYRLLRKRVTDLGRHELVITACREILAGSEEAWEPLTIESFRNAWQLEPAGQRALLDLIDWHNSLAPGERNKAPESKLLWSIANRLPKSVDTLHQVRGMPRNIAPNHLQRILSITRAADRSDNSAVPVLVPPPYATFERLQLDAWLEYVRCAACAKTEVAKELVLGGHRLRKLRDLVANSGREAFQSTVLREIMGDWQFELLGENLQRAAASIPLPPSL